MNKKVFFKYADYVHSSVASTKTLTIFSTSYFGGMRETNTVELKLSLRPLS